MQRARCGPESCCEHELIVSFRGTKDLYDWFYNLDFRSWSGSGDLHNGFVAAFKFDRAALVDGLVNLLDRVLGSGCSNGCEEKAGLILAGHSLGGAIAQVASLGANRFDYDNGIGDWLTEVECGVRKRMRNRSSVPNLRPAGYLGRGWFELSSTYAFGSPKVSKSGVLGNGIRLAVVNHPDDLVPNLPPRILGFRRSKMALTRTGDELSQYRGIGLRLSDLRSLKRKLACHKIENYRLWLAG